MEVDAPLIVVPDGLRVKEGSHRIIPEPSFVYRAVLDFVAKVHGGNCVYLAPANDFGCGVTEQEAALVYLRNKGLKRLLTPRQLPQRYIDTRGNARELRTYLEAQGLWPLPPASLVVADRHARRALLCFEKEGFFIRKVFAVKYQIPATEKIVRRLWYYRYSRLHFVYELLAYTRDLVVSSGVSDLLRFSVENDTVVPKKLAFRVSSNSELSGGNVSLSLPTIIRTLQPRNLSSRMK